MLSQPQLPKEIIRHLVNFFNKFTNVERYSSLLLLSFSIAALIISNSRWGNNFLSIWNIQLGFHLGSYTFNQTIREWINNGLMTLFFFLVALELKREFVLGELKDIRVAALSIIAAIGGMIVPVAIYLSILSNKETMQGWGTVMATDTAFLIGSLALLGKRIPHSLRIFLLSLAIVDDIGAILVMTVSSVHGIHFMALGLSLGGFIVILIMRNIGIRSFILYYFIGILIWFLVDLSGIHATITGVVLGFMTPTNRWVSNKRLRLILDRIISYPKGDNWSDEADARKNLRMSEIAIRETLSPLERLEVITHPWVGYFILPLFAFANAGVRISLSHFTNILSVAIFLGFALGKPLGVLSFSWLAEKTRLAIRPPDLSWGLIAGGGLLTGIGFTMAIFIAELSINESLIAYAKVGIFSASIFCAITGVSFLFWYTSSRLKGV